MIIFLRSAPITTDARIQKFLNVLKLSSVKEYVICWDRDGEIEENERLICFKKKSKHGDRLKNILKIIGWNLFILNKLFKLKNNFSIVHAVDFDTALPAFVFCKLFKKKFIFDIYDKYTDSRQIKGLIGRCIDHIETYILENADLGVLVSEQRLQQHNVTKTNNIEIIENVPVNVHFTNSYKKSDILRISYVGGLEKETRNLEFLVQLAKDIPDVIIDVAGYGPLTDYFNSYSKLLSNLSFHGKVSYSNGLEIMNNSDLIIGMYNINVPNHAYASPNKYYEHLFLGKPLITTKNTPPGLMVERDNTGFAINDSYQEFRNSIEYILLNRSKLNELAENAQNIWIKRYSDYFNDVFVGIYLKKIKYYASRN